MIAYPCSIARYWKDPYEFRPQRFMEDWPKDAFLPFSGGARQCIGRRYVNSSLSLQYFFTENNSKKGSLRRNQSQFLRFSYSAIVLKY